MNPGDRLSEADRAKIEAFVRQKGVTKCPPAAVAETTAEFDAEARAALRGRPAVERMTNSQAKSIRLAAAQEKDPAKKARMLDDVRRLYDEPMRRDRAAHAPPKQEIKPKAAPAQTATAARPAPPADTARQAASASPRAIALARALAVAQEPRAAARPPGSVIVPDVVPAPRVALTFRPRAEPGPSAFDGARQRFLAALSAILEGDELATEEKAEQVVGTISAIRQLATIAGLDDA